MRMVPFPELDINDFEQIDSERPDFFNQRRKSEKVLTNSTPVKDEALRE